jgi:hypothetical protein
VSNTITATWLLLRLNIPLQPPRSLTLIQSAFPPRLKWNRIHVLNFGAASVSLINITIWAVILDAHWDRRVVETSLHVRGSGTSNRLIGTCYNNRLEIPRIPLLSLFLCVQILQPPMNRDLDRWGQRSDPSFYLRLRCHSRRYSYTLGIHAFPISTHRFVYQRCPRGGKGSAGKRSCQCYKLLKSFNPSSGDPLSPWLVELI